MNNKFCEVCGEYKEVKYMISGRRVCNDCFEEENRKVFDKFLKNKGLKD